MRITRMTRILFGLVALILSLPAWAQYYVQATAPVEGTCTIFDEVDDINDRTVFSITATGTMALPEGSPTNMVAIGGTNVDGRWFMTQLTGPRPLPSPLPWIVHRLPTVDDPVTLGLSLYPVIAGAAVGTGFGVGVSCDSNGVFSASPSVIVSAEAGAPYSVSYTGGVIGGTCSETNISGSVNGSVFLPPPLDDNLVVYIAINGTPVGTDYNTLNPAATSGIQTFDYDIPPTTIPYSITGTVYPWRNGTPVGTGVTITYHCTAQGLSSSEPQSVTAARSTPVPALSSWALLLLAGLSAWVAVRRMRGTA